MPRPQPRTVEPPARSTARTRTAAQPRITRRQQHSAKPDAHRRLTHGSRSHREGDRVCSHGPVWSICELDRQAAWSPLSGVRRPRGLIPMAHRKSCGSPGKYKTSGHRRMKVRIAIEVMITAKKTPVAEPREVGTVAPAMLVANPMLKPTLVASKMAMVAWRALIFCSSIPFAALRACTCSDCVVLRCGTSSISKSKCEEVDTC